MNHIKLRLIWSGLLHDIGKVILRSGLGEAGYNHSQAGAKEISSIIGQSEEQQSVVACIRYHHIRELLQSGLPFDHPAWIICEADNIAAGADRRNKSGEGDAAVSGQRFDANKRLDSIFNIVRTQRNKDNLEHEYPLVYGKHDEQRLIAPIERTAEGEADQEQYAAIWRNLAMDLQSIDWQDSSYLNSVYGILDSYLSYVPSSTDQTQLADISLFDHVSLTTAVACCIHDCLEERKISDYRSFILNDVRAFRNEPLFLLAHADLSGIQDFLYTISSKQALKSLRGRSFYLELILEQIADEILTSLELSRANLLYNGGGGFFMLLPNTEKARSLLEQAYRQINQWLYDHFAVQLYLGLGGAPATASQFMQQEDTEVSSLRDVYRDVSRIISVQKLQRFATGDIATLFTPAKPVSGDRECRVCGQSGRLMQVKETDTSDTDAYICQTCHALIKLGTSLAKGSAQGPDTSCVFAVIKDMQPGNLNLPLPSLAGTHYLATMTPAQTRELLIREPRKTVRIYSKNHRASGLSIATRLWIADYNHCIGKEDGAVEFKDFIEAPGDKGIGRLGVLRADIDNLGRLFAEGLRGDAPDKGMYETLGRSAVLSRSLSRFFRSHMNHIAAEGNRNLVIVYSGGDDLFMVGPWHEMIDFALDLREKFRLFTGDKLSFSAGIGMFRPDFPISRMAEITGDLETQAKRGEKDQIALFGLESSSGRTTCKHVYTWHDLSEYVLPMRDFLLGSLKLDNEQQQGQFAASMSFMYKMLHLLQSPDEKLSLARLMYLIARRDPGNQANTLVKEHYEHLRKNLYTWATNKQSRKHLITAIMLCIYSARKRGEN